MKTHCLRGHEYTDANTQWRTNGWRECLTCKRERDRDRRAEQAYWHVRRALSEYRKQTA